VHYIDRTLMAGDWYCYGKSTVGSPSTVHTSTGLHTEMSVQSLQTDAKLWWCPCGCHSGMHFKGASNSNNILLPVILIFITLGCSLKRFLFPPSYSFRKFYMVVKKFTSLWALHHFWKVKQLPKNMSVSHI
jgi:hypothetical protein